MNRGRLRWCSGDAERPADSAGRPKCAARRQVGTEFETGDHLLEEYRRRLRLLERRAQERG